MEIDKNLNWFFTDDESQHLENNNRFWTSSEPYEIKESKANKTFESKVMNSIASFRLCTLSDDELLKRIDKKTDQLFDNKDKRVRDRILSRHIPAIPDNDYDLLIGELLIRFNELKAKKEDV